jgi:hypothetical protein
METCSHVRTSQNLNIYLLQDYLLTFRIILRCLLREGLYNPFTEYSRRHEWIEHVKQSHWKTYGCILCQSKLSSSADCKRHLETCHPTKRSLGELEALVKLCEQAIDINKGMRCPLCREDLHSVRQYQRHVGSASGTTFPVCLAFAGYGGRRG